MRKAAFIYSDELSKRDRRLDEIFGPTRLLYTYELLKSYGAFDRTDSEVISPKDASEHELLSFHNKEYVEAVKSLSNGEMNYEPHRFNFSDTGDNPVYSGMYELSTLVVGASLTATELVLSGDFDVTFNCAGGLHHAAPDHVSGFCIFNDVVIAIKKLCQKDLRVAYIDIDSHHGDAVQNAFYDTDQVLTISLHQTGRLLFPGTGEVQEIGIGAGKGYAVNIPLAPYTDDEIYLWAFDQIVPEIINRYRPDVVVTQLGADSHYIDPLTQLCLTTAGYSDVVDRIRKISTKWIALGGGGYEISVVVRFWTLAYGKMIGIDWPNQIPVKFQERYGITYLRDNEQPRIKKGLKDQARRFAEDSVSEIKRLIYPFHGLSSFI